MALNQILDLSTTAANNLDFIGVGIPEGMFPDKVNDAMRALGKILADGVTRHVTKAAGTYTALKTDHNQFWRCTGAVTLNLTAAATLTDGWSLWVRANGGAVTIDPNGAETINGAATITLNDYQMALIICTGTTFHVVMQSNFLPHVAQGRLTLTTGVPVTTTDVTAAGTLYYTPYIGNSITLYTTTAGWVTRTFSELSLALTLTSGKPYDVFIFDNAGTPTLEVLVWTNDTTRATAIGYFEGAVIKSAVATRRYVGTIYSSGANTTEDSVAKRFVWNMFNRVRRGMYVKEATDTWTYTTATMRQARGVTTNVLAMVRGLDEDAADARVRAMFGNSTINVAAASAIGLDSNTTPATESNIALGNAYTAGTAIQNVADYNGLPGVGYHELRWLEYSQAAGTTTWYGDNGGLGITQTGIFGAVFA